MHVFKTCQVEFDMPHSMHAAEFYMRESKQSPSNDFYLINVAIAYVLYHSASEDRKKLFHKIM